jgi:multiple sugar transport system permease protein
MHGSAAAPRPSPEAKTPRSGSTNRRRLRFFSRIALVATSIIAFLAILFPVYWMFVTSTTSDSELASYPPRFFPNLGRLGVYGDVLSGTRIVTWLGNSAVIALGTCILSIILAVFAAYALSRHRFHGKSVFGFSLFATQMLPEALLVVPFYALFITLGLLNNLGGLVLVNTAFVMPVLVWLLKGAIDTIPFEIEESARVDGASPLTILRLIVGPLITPSVAAGAVIAFFYGWDEYLFARTFITADAAEPASVGLAGFIGEYFIPVNQVMAASVMYALPAIVFFILLQRYVVSGLVAGSVKG